MKYSEGLRVRPGWSRQRLLDCGRGTKAEVGAPQDCVLVLCVCACVYVYEYVCMSM